MSQNIHQNRPLATAGANLETAAAAMILVHGRGATAQGMIQMAQPFMQGGVAYLAPQAGQHSWYPESFLEPVEQNEPERSSGLDRIAALVDQIHSAGLSTEQIMFCGFSQGACLASEYIARHPKRYGGAAILSGGLIGGSIDPAEYTGDLEHTPVFIGCSDTDPHIPESRVHETADVLQRLNADVDVRLYSGMGHRINQDEISAVKSLQMAATDAE